METGQLDYRMVQEQYGKDHMSLSTIYLICEILARREPGRGTARDLFLEFARQYADNKALSGQ